MTLILELHDPIVGGSIFISDCMVRDLNRNDLRPNNFPLHRGSGWQIETKGVGLVSKLISSKNKIILGAGLVHRIEAVAAEFLRQSPEELFGFHEFLDSFYETREETEAYIYAMGIDGKSIGSDSYCRRFQTGHLNVICAGSGAEYFEKVFGNLKPDPDQGLFSLAAQALAIIHRLEFTDYTFPQHDFGGAYEVAVIDQSGLRRIPYSIIDATGDSAVAEDGAYEIENVTTRRCVFCMPVEHGSRFAIAELVEERKEVSIVDVGEPGYIYSEYDKQFDLKSLFEGFEPLFDIVLLRHQDVNWRLGRNLAKFSFEGNNLYIDVSLKDIYEAVANDA